MTGYVVFHICGFLGITTKQILQYSLFVIEQSETVEEDGLTQRTLGQTTKCPRRVAQLLWVTRGLVVLRSCTHKVISPRNGTAVRSLACVSAARRVPHVPWWPYRAKRVASSTIHAFIDHVTLQLAPPRATAGCDDSGRAGGGRRARRSCVRAIVRAQCERYLAL